MQRVDSGNSMVENRMGSETGTDLAAFERWVRARRLAPEQRLRFFVGWVERFLRLRAARTPEDWQDTLRVFLEDLSQGQTKSWQLRQAADAVTLYCGQFCEPRDTPVLPILPTESEPVDPNQILAQMRRLLELRHYSPRTNRTYLGWTRRFLQYTLRATLG